MKKREVLIHIAEVISANKNILTPLELAVKVSQMPGVAVVDREAELPILEDGEEPSGWVKELKD